jgi:hypothetical protein
LTPQRSGGTAKRFDSKAQGRAAHPGSAIAKIDALRRSATRRFPGHTACKDAEIRLETFRGGGVLLTGNAPHQCLHMRRPDGKNESRFKRFCCTPSECRDLLRLTHPGCAARPWALGFNRFAVATQPCTCPCRLSRRSLAGRCGSSRDRQLKLEKSR